MDETSLALEDFLRLILERKGSDVYIVPGAKVMAKVNDQLEALSENKLKLAECEDLIRQIYCKADSRSMERLTRDGDDDFSFGLASLGRFRCNAFRQRGTLAAVLRVVPFALPDAKALHIPDAVLNLSARKRGMALVTGPAGSGKTTTLACIIDQINQNRSGHIITLEDPIEYIHPHKRCLVTQREIANDTCDFSHALRASLRQAPDVILLGEMRDFETIQTALTAAETGHLLLSTLHTLGASKTIDRIIDVFPASQQQQVRIQLSMVLQAVVSQQLIPTLDGGIVPAFEVMLVNSAVANMIRENKVQQMDNVIYAGSSEGMISMDNDILRLYRAKRISRENALMYAINPDLLAKRL
ncbi:MAG TPA: PilT/PilU family type 4a pilus ATPase [Candidatus Limiplasma sp.]|nr:PilT/PilU family type 4a pilus ATPase [Candidatus Limiplasma sp.]